MTQLGYQSSVDPQVVRRKKGILAWGIVVIVIGALLGIGGVAVVAAMWSQLQQLAGPARRPPRIGYDAIYAAIALLLSGGGALWVGIATCMAKRWVRPVIIVCASAVVVLGMLNIAFDVANFWDITHAPSSRRWRVLPTTLIAAVLLRVFVELAILVIVPWVAASFFRSAKTLRALEELDPEPSWSDRMPAHVLGWFAVCAAVSFLLFARFLILLKDAPLAVPVPPGPMMIRYVLALALFASASALLYLRRNWIVWSITEGVMLVNLAAAVLAMYMEPVPVRPSSQIVEPTLSPQLAFTIASALAVGYGWYVGRFFPDRPPEPAQGTTPPRDS